MLLQKFEDYVRKAAYYRWLWRERGGMSGSAERDWEIGHSLQVGTGFERLL